MLSGDKYETVESVAIQSKIFDSWINTIHLDSIEKPKLFDQIQSFIKRHKFDESYHY